MARILLADDDVATLDFVRRALTSDGHDVVATQNGSEALEWLTREPGSFALLISDVQMPGMDGLTLAAKALESDARLRIILMSGFAGGFAAADALKGRIHAMLTKPLTLEQMRRHVRGALGG